MTQPKTAASLCDCELSHNGMGMAGRECDCEERKAAITAEATPSLDKMVAEYGRSPAMSALQAMRAYNQECRPRSFVTSCDGDSGRAARPRKPR